MKSNIVNRLLLYKKEDIILNDKAIMVISGDYNNFGRIIDCNWIGEKLLQYDTGSLSSKSLSEIMYPPHYQTLRKSISKLFKVNDSSIKKSWNLLCLRSTDGIYIIANTQIIPYSYSKGSLKLIFAFEEHPLMKLLQSQAKHYNILGMLLTDDNNIIGKTKSIPGVIIDKLEEINEDIGINELFPDIDLRKLENEPPEKLDSLVSVREKGEGAGDEEMIVKLVKYKSPLSAFKILLLLTKAALINTRSKTIKDGKQCMPINISQVPKPEMQELKDSNYKSDSHLVGGIITALMILALIGECIITANMIGSIDAKISLVLTLSNRNQNLFSAVNRAREYYEFFSNDPLRTVSITEAAYKNYKSQFASYSSLLISTDRDINYHVDMFESIVKDLYVNVSTFNESLGLNYLTLQYKIAFTLVMP